MTAGPDGALTGRTALITGAGSGIGRAIAVRLAREGAWVAVADVDGSGAAATAAQIAGEGRRGRAVTVDVADADGVRRAVRDVADEAGQLDILVNDAGVVVGGTASETSDLDWDRNLDVNLRGMFHCCREALPLMVSRGGGAIVSISSTTALHPVRARAAYAAAKAGVLGLTRSIAVDYAEHGVRANAVAPGTVNTPLLRGRLHDAEAATAIVEGIPLRRFAEPEEIAAAVLFLASDESAYITGQMLVVDGGASVP